MKTTKQLRLLVMGLVLALTLAAAGPAVAEPPSWSDGWVTSGLDHLGRWWTSVWGAQPGSVRAGSGVTPNLDPNGVTPQPAEPDGSSLTESQEPRDDSEVTPNIDPNG